MLVFGVDIPLIEVIFAVGIIMFILLIETIVVISLLIKQMNKSKRLAELVEKLSDSILDIKRSEIQELDKLNRRVIK